MAEVHFMSDESNNGVTLRNDLYGFEVRDVDNRRVEQEDRKNYNIKQLWQRSHEIINLAAQGFKQAQIAEILNVHPVTVSNTLNSDLGQHKMAELRRLKDEDAKITVEKIRVLRDKALQVYHEVFDDVSGETNLKDKARLADTVILELSGLRVPTKVQSTHVSTTLTVEELKEFKKRGLEAARQSGLIIDTVCENDDLIEGQSTEGSNDPLSSRDSEQTQNGFEGRIRDGQETIETEKVGA